MRVAALPEELPTFVPTIFLLEFFIDENRVTFAH